MQGFVPKSRPPDINEVNQRKLPPIALKKDPVPLPTIPVKQPMQNLKSNFEPKGVTSGNSFQKPVPIPKDTDSGADPDETPFQRARRLAKENANSNSVSSIFE